MTSQTIQNSNRINPNLFSNAADFKDALNRLVTSKTLFVDAKGTLIGSDLVRNALESQSSKGSAILNSRLIELKVIEFLTLNKMHLNTEKDFEMVQSLARQAGLLPESDDSVRSHQELRTLVKMLGDKILQKKEQAESNYANLCKAFTTHYRLILAPYAAHVAQVNQTFQELYKVKDQLGQQQGNESEFGQNEEGTSAESDAQNQNMLHKQDEAANVIAPAKANKPSAVEELVIPESKSDIDPAALKSATVNEPKVEPKKQSSNWSTVSKVAFGAIAAAAVAAATFKAYQYYYDGIPNPQNPDGIEPINPIGDGKQDVDTSSHSDLDQKSNETHTTPEGNQHTQDGSSTQITDGQNSGAKIEPDDGSSDLQQSQQAGTGQTDGQNVNPEPEEDQQDNAEGDSTQKSFLPQQTDFVPPHTPKASTTIMSTLASLEPITAIGLSILGLGGAYAVFKIISNGFKRNDINMNKPLPPGTTSESSAAAATSPAARASSTVTAAPSPAAAAQSPAASPLTGLPPASGSTASTKKRVQLPLPHDELPSTPIASAIVSGDPRNNIRSVSSPSTPLNHNNNNNNAGIHNRFSSLYATVSYLTPSSENEPRTHTPNSISKFASMSDVQARQLNAGFYANKTTYLEKIDQGIKLASRIVDHLAQNGCPANVTEECRYYISRLEERYGKLPNAFSLQPKTPFYNTTYLLYDLYRLLSVDLIEFEPQTDDPEEIVSNFKSFKEKSLTFRLSLSAIKGEKDDMNYFPKTAKCLLYYLNDSLDFSFKHYEQAHKKIASPHAIIDLKCYKMLQEKIHACFEEAKECKDEGACLEFLFKQPLKLLTDLISMREESLKSDNLIFSPSQAQGVLSTPIHGLRGTASSYHPQNGGANESAIMTPVPASDLYALPNDGNTLSGDYGQITPIKNLTPPPHGGLGKRSSYRGYEEPSISDTALSARTFQKQQSLANIMIQKAKVKLKNIRADEKIQKFNELVEQGLAKIGETPLGDDLVNLKNDLQHFSAQVAELHASIQEAVNDNLTQKPGEDEDDAAIALGGRVVEWTDTLERLHCDHLLLEADVAKLEVQNNMAAPPPPPPPPGLMLAAPSSSRKVVTNQNKLPKDQRLDPLAKPGTRFKKTVYPDEKTVAELKKRREELATLSNRYRGLIEEKQDVIAELHSQAHAMQNQVSGLFRQKSTIADYRQQSNVLNQTAQSKIREVGQGLRKLEDELSELTQELNEIDTKLKGSEVNKEKDEIVDIFKKQYRTSDLQALHKILSTKDLKAASVVSQRIEAFASQSYSGVEKVMSTIRDFIETSVTVLVMAFFNEKKKGEAGTLDKRMSTAVSKPINTLKTSILSEFKTFAEAAEKVTEDTIVCEIEALQTDLIAQVDVMNLALTKALADKHFKELLNKWYIDIGYPALEAGQKIEKALNLKASELRDSAWDQIDRVADMVVAIEKTAKTISSAPNADEALQAYVLEYGSLQEQLTNLLAIRGNVKAAYQEAAKISSDHTNAYEENSLVGFTEKHQSCVSLLEKALLENDYYSNLITEIRDLKRTINDLIQPPFAVAKSKSSKSLINDAFTKFEGACEHFNATLIKDTAAAVDKLKLTLARTQKNVLRAAKTKSDKFFAEKPGANILPYFERSEEEWKQVRDEIPNFYDALLDTIAMRMTGAISEPEEKVSKVVVTTGSNADAAAPGLDAITGGAGAIQNKRTARSQQIMALLEKSKTPSIAKKPQPADHTENE